MLKALFKEIKVDSFNLLTIRNKLGTKSYVLSIYDSRLLNGHYNLYSDNIEGFVAKIEALFSKDSIMLKTEWDKIRLPYSENINQLVLEGF